MEKRIETVLKMKSKVNWSYIAGFFDGEGCVSVDRNNKSVYLYFVNTDKFVLEIIQRFLTCGKIRQMLPSDNRFAKRPVYRLDIRRRDDVMFVMKKLISKCIIKKAALKKAIKFRQSVKYISPAKQRNHKKFGKDELERLYSYEGKSWAEIEDELGYCRHILWRRLREYNIPLRPRFCSQETREKIRRTIRAKRLDPRND